MGGNVRIRSRKGAAQNKGRTNDKSNSSLKMLYQFLKDEDDMANDEKTLANTLVNEQLSHKRHQSFGESVTMESMEKVSELDLLSSPIPLQSRDTIRVEESVDEDEPMVSELI